MDFPKTNLHIHSNFTDGKDSIKQIVKKSIKKGLEIIAITDHFTNSWKGDVIHTLDSKEKIYLYLEEISECQLYLEEQNHPLKLYKGIEIDLESSKDHIIKLINPKDYDIILFEYLETVASIAFIKPIINSWKKSLKNDDTLPFLGLAHFDPSHFTGEYLESIIDFLKEFNIYFEFNSRYPVYYSRKYKEFFNQLKENNIQVAIGCDSHTSRRLDDIEEPLEMIELYGLKENLNSFLVHLKRK